MKVANYNCAINLVCMPKKAHRSQWGSPNNALAWLFPETSQNPSSRQVTTSTDPDRRTRRGGNPNWGLRGNNTLSRPFSGLLQDSCSLITQIWNPSPEVNIRATFGLKRYCPEAWGMFCGAGEEHLGIPRDLLQEVKGGIKGGKRKELRWLEEEEQWENKEESRGCCM